MKTLARILLTGFMACPVLGFSQQIPLFEFTMYFEDGIGNRDSIVLGYDPNASSQNLNLQFGETLLDTPFDSVFEVRAIHGDDGQNRTVKKAIEDVDILSWDSCALPFFSKIVINAKFLPVKISYDSTLFPINSCRNIILSRNRDMFFIPDWWDACGYHCMAGSSGYMEYFGPPQPDPLGLCWNWLFVEKEVAGQGIKMLPGLFLATFYGPGPCNDTTFLSVHNESLSDFGALSPNPSSGNFSIQVHSVGEVDVVIRDVNGRLVSCPFGVAEGSVRVDASRLPAGIYFALLQDSRGRSAVYKFVKL